MAIRAKYENVVFKPLDDVDFRGRVPRLHLELKSQIFHTSDNMPEWHLSMTSQTSMARIQHTV